MCGGRGCRRQQKGYRADAHEEKSGAGHQQMSARTNIGAHRQCGPGSADETTRTEEPVKARHDRPAEALFDGDCLGVHSDVDTPVCNADQGKGESENR